MAVDISWNWGCHAMFSHDCCMNSSTGMVHETMGYLVDENVCVALAGSCQAQIILG
jgi:hypothetical protein